MPIPVLIKRPFTAQDKALTAILAAIAAIAVALLAITKAQTALVAIINAGIKVVFMYPTKSTNAPPKPFPAVRAALIARYF